MFRLIKNKAAKIAAIDKKQNFRTKKEKRGTHRFQFNFTTYKADNTMPSLTSQWTQFLREIALRHGFMGVGISRAEYMDEEAVRLDAWLNKGFNGEMSYMANHFDKRVDPTKLMPGAKSVVSLLYNYFPAEKHSQLLSTQSSDFHDKSSSINEVPSESPSFKISRYAYGEDYHKVVRRKLKAIVQDLKIQMGDFHGRVFVDSAPVMERDWAKRSGLGWIGKNTLLINPKKGSYFFLAEIILDVEFDYDHPMRDHCGTCTRCIDACPTEAISPEGYILDGSKCISYLTIELKSNIPETFKGKMQDWIFGCDICQEVCPWNRFASPHQETAFESTGKMKEINKNDWIEMTEEVFETIFEKSPLKRSGFSGLKRNVQFNMD
ncbi:MAG TPA: tRNA epoxyqueuosine(34) reductase QueG [Saprospiraceae bacterium]|nr:tRNA epoxyqueuosine(34) reductase QueG [Saprospiraceae bacterium]